MGDRHVGWIGSAARHFELGPIATAVLKRTVPIDATLVVRCAGDIDVAAAQEVIVTPGMPSR